MTGVRSGVVASLTELSFLKDYKGDIDGALASLDEAEKRLDNGMDEELADILKNRYRIFSKYGIADRLPELLIKVDSLMSAASDDRVRLMWLGGLSALDEKGGQSETSWRIIFAYGQECRNHLPSARTRRLFACNNPSGMYGDPECPNRT